MKSNDVFISYKSHDAEVARDFVEILRINEVKTWFAEYSIDLEHWLTADDSWIDKTLEHAVKCSGHVIIFSSHQWHASKWCQKEYEHALSELNADDISVVRLDDCELGNQFNGIHSIRHDPEDFLATVRFLARRLNTRLELPKGPDLEGKTALVCRGPYSASLLCGPLQKFDYLWIRGLEGTIGGIPVRCAIYFHPLRTTGRLFGQSPDSLVESTRNRLLQNPDANDNPDRLIYREYAQRASYASKESGTKVFGLHLIKAKDDRDGTDNYLDGETGFSVSKIYRIDSQRFAVVRDYCLRLNNGPEQPVGELMISFTTYVKWQDEEVAKLFLSKIAPFFDRVAASVQYHRKELTFVRTAFLTRITILVLSLLGLSVGIAWITGITNPLSQKGAVVVPAIFSTLAILVFGLPRLLSKYIPNARILMGRG